MTIDEALEILSDYCCMGSREDESTSAAFGSSIYKVEDALEMARQALRDKKKRQCNCKDCKNWTPTGSMCIDSHGNIEKLGTCIWIQGVFAENDYCSKAKRHEQSEASQDE